MEMEHQNEEIVVLKIQDETFKCQKQLLISYSDYFKAMFSSNFIESQKEEIELKDIDSNIMRDIISFINGQSKSLFQDVKSSLLVLQCASMLQFSEIQKLSEEYLIHSLSFKNCLDIFEWSFKLNNLVVSETALTFALWSFKDVMEAENFLSLSAEAVCNYLGRPELNLGLTGEWLIWEAILKWIEYDEEERKVYTLPLLLCLDFTQLSSDDVSSMIFYDVISSQEDAKRLLNCVVALRRGMLDGETLEPEREPEPEPDHWRRNYAEEVTKRMKHFRRSDSSIPCCVFGVRGQARERSMSFPQVFCYDEPSKRIEKVAELSKLDLTFDSCVGYRVNAVGPSIYVTGGQYMIGSKNWNNDFWSYSTISKQWHVLPRLPTPRRNHMTCVVGSVLYLMGGYGKHRIALNTVDGFDTRTGTWFKCADLPIHGGAAACSFQREILVFVNNLLFTFYPDRNKWIKSEFKTCGPMRAYCTAVTLGDTIYLLAMHSNNIFRFSHASNTLEYFGSFRYETYNVCVVSSHLFSFTLRKNEDEDSEHEFVVEKMPLGDQAAKSTKEENENSPIESSSVVLTEKVLSEYIHTCLNEASPGCFPLFRLPKEWSLAKGLS